MSKPSLDPDGASSGFKILMLFTPILWAGAFYAAVPAVASAGPGLSTLLRFASATLVLLPFLWLTHRKAVIPFEGQIVKYAVVSALLGGLGYHLLFYAGAGRTDPVRAAVIVGMNPAWTAILEAVVLRRALGRRFWGGLVLALAGAMVALTAGKDLSGLTTSWTPGDTLLMAASLSWATYSVTTQSMRQPGWDGRWMGAYFAVGTAIASVIPAWPDLHLISSFQPADWGPHLYLGVLSTAIGYTLFSEGIVRLGAARAALYVFLVPVMTAIMRPLITGEAMLLWDVIGAVLVFGGLALGLRTKKPASA